jgi:hypothetical protein
VEKPDILDIDSFLAQRRAAQDRGGLAANGELISVMLSRGANCAEIAAYLEKKGLASVTRQSVHAYCKRRGLLKVRSDNRAPHGKVPLLGNQSVGTQPHEKGEAHETHAREDALPSPSPQQDNSAPNADTPGRTFEPESAVSRAYDWNQIPLTSGSTPAGSERPAETVTPFASVFTAIDATSPAFLAAREKVRRSQSN